MALHNLLGELALDTTVRILTSAVNALNSAPTANQPGLPLLAVRRDTDVAPADGTFGLLGTDNEGRLKVSGKPSYLAPTTGTITANGQTVFADVSRASNLVIHCKGTFSTVNVTFEASIDSTNGTDGTWWAVQGVRSSPGTIEGTTGNLSAAPAYSWEFSVNGYNWFRVRATAYTSGTQTWVFQRGSYATEPAPAVQTHAVTGSGTFTVGGSLTSAGTTTNTPAAGTQLFVTTGATTNAAFAKASAGSLYEVTISNHTGATIYVKFFNKTSAPTLGTDLPVMTIAVASGATDTREFGALGKRFATGIAYAVTANAAWNDNTAVAANAIIHGTFI